MLDRVFILCSLFFGISSVIIRDYNEVNYFEFASAEDLAQRFFTLEGRKSNTNLIVGVAEDSCYDKFDSPAFKGAQRHAGGRSLSVVSLHADGFPLPLEKCAEVFFYPFNTGIENPTERTDQLDHISLTRWTGDRTRTSVELSNGFNFPIQIYWLEESNDPLRQFLLQPREATVVNTFLGHIFEAREVVDIEHISDSDPLVDFMVVSEDKYSFNAHNRLETCEVVPGAKRFVEGDLSCDDMEMRLVEFSHQVWYEKRLGLNFVQPQLVPPVTANGFENRRLPENTFKWLREWYEREQLAIENDESTVGPCMNQHVAMSRITHLTSTYKNQLSRELKPVLEEWYGKGPLELTSIYGIRKYTNGSVLRMHVDTVNTHVVSAIINVDQKVDQDWPLIILDHDDGEHRVNMRAGDMLLYESAKLLHGRPEPFVGEHYDNIFIHYKPVSGWDYSWV